MQISFDTKDDIEDLKRLYSLLGSLIKKRSAGQGNGYQDMFSSNEEDSHNDPWDNHPQAVESSPAPSTQSGGMFNMFSDGNASSSSSSSGNLHDEQIISDREHIDPFNNDSEDTDDDTSKENYKIEVVDF